MPAGRPPKPTALKLLQGNPGKRALPKHEPTPPEGQIKAPAWLHGKSRAAWKWIAPVLEPMGLLTTADTHALALLCDAYAEYIACREVVRAQGATYESKVFNEDGDGGWTVMVRPRPEVKMASDAWRRVQRMMSDFGLSPSSRAKVPGKPQDEADPLLEWMHGSRGTA